MRILHLEDERLVQDSIKKVINALEPQGELYQFISSDNAIPYIEQCGNAVDLFVLDIRVPGKVDGLGVARKIRDLGCAGMVVITSGYMKPSQDLLAELGCKWYGKPWHIIDIHETILTIKRSSLTASSSSH